jgi:hypothetical protein
VLSRLVGSNPTLSALSFLLQVHRSIGRRQANRPRGYPRPDLLQPYCNPLRKYVLHGSGGLICHARQHVGVGVQSDRYGGVAQEFLHEFGVHASTEQEGGARVIERSGVFGRVFRSFRNAAIRQGRKADRLKSLR